MENRICEELREFNKIYKEFDDLWHETALHIGLSDSAFDILYSVYCLGDGCLQRDICALSFGRKQTHQFGDPETGERRAAPNETGKREGDAYIFDGSGEYICETKGGTFGGDRRQRLEGDAARRETGTDPADKTVCGPLSCKNKEADCKSCNGRGLI